MTRLLPLLLCSLTLPALAESQWFKGNTHTHSLWSDGDDFPEMITDWYVKNGYDFLGLSDHNVLARGERWWETEAVEKRRKGIGRKVMDKYLDRFGPDWVVTRDNAEGKQEVRLRTLEEYRPLFEKPGQFLLIEAEEVTAAKDSMPIHINAVNLTEEIPPIKDLATVRETMRANLLAIAEHGRASGKPLLVHLNHPNFKWSITAEDIAHVIEDKFFEVFNGHPSVYNDGHPDRADSAMDRLWDIANTIRIAELKAAPLYGVGTDDSHNYHGGPTSPGRGWVMVRADKLEADTLVEAMHRGDFYASSGVTLKDVRFDQGTKTLSLEIDGAEGVTYTTTFLGTRKGYDRAVEKVPAPEGDKIPFRLRYSQDVGAVLASSDSLTPSYQMTGDELYVRAVVTSSQAPKNPIEPGQVAKAWTQPVGW